MCLALAGATHDICSPTNLEIGLGTLRIDAQTKRSSVAKTTMVALRTQAVTSIVRSRFGLGFKDDIAHLAIREITPAYREAFLRALNTWSVCRGSAQSELTMRAGLARGYVGGVFGGSGSFCRCRDLM